MKADICWLLGLSLCVTLTLGSSALAEEQVFRGELAKGDKVDKQTNGFVDHYVFKAKAGDLVTVTMEADQGSTLDTYLHVVGPSGQEYENDDAEDGTGSKVTFRVPETGEWEIAATSYSEATGAYIVKVSTQSLKLLLSERGELEEGDGVLLKGGELYDKFTLNVEAGKTYVVMAVSSDFDTFVAAHYPGGFINNGGVGGSGNMSRVVFTPKESGEATLVITSNYKRSEGRYHLTAYETVKEPEGKTP